MIISLKTFDQNSVKFKVNKSYGNETNAHSSNSNAIQARLEKKTLIVVFVNYYYYHISYIIINYSI